MKLDIKITGFLKKKIHKKTAVTIQVYASGLQTKNNFVIYKGF